jgi:uncharacterized membrane protein YcjF (UPF0283 family)
MASNTVYYSSPHCHAKCVVHVLVTATYTPIVTVTQQEVVYTTVRSVPANTAAAVKAITQQEEIWHNTALQGTLIGILLAIALLTIEFYILGRLDRLKEERLEKERVARSESVKRDLE